MADNTEQYKWITRLVTNLKHLLRDQTALVAGDLLWYPVQVAKGETPPSQAPDVMVVLGRPMGYRGSYQQWQEENIAPQVVFEIISPSNTASEMAAKQIFYAQHGVLEIYFYDPLSRKFWGLVREKPTDDLRPVMALNLPWVSPLLNICFELPNELKLSHPDGQVFKDPEAFALGEAQAQAKLERAIAQMREAGLDVSDFT